MRKFICLLLAGLLLSAQLLWAQNQITVSGKVTEAKDGSPIPGVSVKAKGSNAGTFTDPNGNFKITLDPKTKTLIFSSVGYNDQEVAIVAGKDISIAMIQSEKSLSEVIVVGYGTKIKRDVTGSIAKVGAKEIGNTPITSFEGALQGRAAGVFVERITAHGGICDSVRVVLKGAYADGCIGSAANIRKKRAETHGCIFVAGGVGIERLRTVGRVVDAVGVAKKREHSIGRVVVGGGVVS